MQIDEHDQKQCSCGTIIKQKQKNYCEQCTIYSGNQKSQQIIKLREKLKFYQLQQKQLQTLAKLSQQQQNQTLLKPLQNYLQKQIISQAEADRQINYLQNQYSILEIQLQKQKIKQKQQNQQFLSLIDQINSLEIEYYEYQNKYKQLVQFYSKQIYLKENQLKSFKSLLERTNFDSLIFTISFDGKDSFLNGQKIILDNSWKIVEIICFYHNKYPNYQPQVQILFQSMSIAPSLKINKLVNKISQQLKQQTKNSQKNKKIHQQKHLQPIQIACQDEEEALNQWLPYIIIETKYLFQFLKGESGVGSTYRLKYQINSFGQFQMLKSKDLTLNQKFILTIKYLLSDIQQLSKLQFFAVEKRIKNAKLKKVQ